MDELTEAANTERLLNWEWSYFARVNSRIAEVAEKLGSSDVAWASIRDRLSRPLRDVVSQEESRYCLPRPVSYVLKSESEQHLQQLLLQLRTLNNTYIGWSVRHALSILNCDPTVLKLQAEMCAWVAEYVRERTSVPVIAATQDRVAVYCELYDELIPFLTDLACDRDALNLLVLEEVLNYLQWELALRTWRKNIRFQLRADGGVDVQTRYLEEPRRKLCGDLIQLYGWAFEHSLPKFVLDLSRAPDAPRLETAGTPDQALTRIRHLAENIAEMRPLLIRNFNPLKATVRLADGVWFSFSWCLHHRLGEIVIGKSPEDVQEQRIRCIHRQPLVLRPDGLLASSPTPWLTAHFFEPMWKSPLPVFAANEVALEAIHDRLFSFYDQIDLDAVLRRLHPRARGAVLEEIDEQELIAATSRHLANQEPDEPDEETPRRTVRALRSQRLFRLLTEKLDCEVRQGKGSEVVVYRPGGRHFTLGHHKRNDTISAGLLRRLLRYIGVTALEWLEAADLDY